MFIEAVVNPTWLRPHVLVSLLRIKKMCSTDSSIYLDLSSSMNTSALTSDRCDAIVWPSVASPDPTATL
jgi:hypothetical protein